MINPIRVVLLCLFLVTFFHLAQAQSQTAKETAPNIVGEWSGDWGPFHPATGTGMVKGLCKSLSCKIELKDGIYLAIFEGDCGRPYKYSIKMEGRQVGKAVLFKGTTDLGEKDGGVFDWIGKANEKEFVGFFTSANYTGTFVLARKN
jgi:hypothetical protein